MGNSSGPKIRKKGGAMGVKWAKAPA